MYHLQLLGPECADDEPGCIGCEVEEPSPIEGKDKDTNDFCVPDSHIIHFYVWLIFTYVGLSLVLFGSKQLRVFCPNKREKNGGRVEIQLPGFACQWGEG